MRCRTQMSNDKYFHKILAGLSHLRTIRIMCVYYDSAEDGREKAFCIIRKTDRVLCIIDQLIPRSQKDNLRYKAFTPLHNFFYR